MLFKKLFEYELEKYDATILEAHTYEDENGFPYCLYKRLGFETIMNNYKKKDKKLYEKNKMNNQMEWTKLMNNYKNVVDEVILKEDIYI